MDEIKQRFVCCGLACDTEEHKTQIVSAFKEMHFPIEYVGQYKTCPGNGGEGGRSDVLFDIIGSDAISRAATHPLHLSGKIRWAEDYWVSDEKLVPKEFISFFDGYK